MSEPRRAQAANQPAMILHLTPIERCAHLALRPYAKPLAVRILHNNVAVARSAEHNIQPGDFLLQAEPFRIDDDRPEERHGGAQPRDRDADLVHGIGIAGFVLTIGMSVD